MNKFNAMVKTAKKKKPKRKKIVLTEQQKEQNLQRKEIRDLMLNIGFSRFSKIDGKNFVYDGRTSELDTPRSPFTIPAPAKGTAQ